MIRHCPKCGALGPAQPRCGQCGARLAAPGDGLSTREILRLAGLLVLFLGSIVLVAAGVLFGVFWLFG